MIITPKNQEVHTKQQQQTEECQRRHFIIMIVNNTEIY